MQATSYNFLVGANVADSAPETDCKGNFRAVKGASFDRMTLGVRATGESTQVIAGLRF